mgnify:CR=1 FL=1
MSSQPAVLIIDDEESLQDLLQHALERDGYRVIVAGTCAEGLAAFARDAPDAILLDVMLPDGSGHDVCREIRATSTVPIIMLTALDDEVDKVVGLELGADDYITKPFDIEELKLRVQRAITRAEQQSLTDPRSGLPSGRLIEEQLRRIIRTQGWEIGRAHV